MGRTLDQDIASLPDERRERVEARYAELKAEVESLSELRRIAGKAQADIAAILDIKQSSVSKIEKQADLYLSALRSCIEAAGGELDLVVRLPSHAPLHLQRIGDATAVTGKAPKGNRAKTRGRATPKQAARPH